MDVFGTAGIRGPVAETVTPALAQAVGRAVAAEGADDAGPVRVGRDGRTTGPGLTAAVTAGLESGGAEVVHVGQVPTPTLAWASRDAVGVMVTASHNPPADNGLKLFADGVEFDDAAEARVADRVTTTEPDPVAWDAWGGDRDADVLPAYRAAVLDYARAHGASLDGLRIAVDCGTGVASLATPQVLTSLGAQVSALNATVDGHFPARESKPTPETLTTLRSYVDGGSFDLGIAHDGDGDRIVFLDGEGAVVHEDTVLAVLAGHFIERATAPDPVVVTTPNASERIDERVAAAGGRTERVRLGALHEGIARVHEEVGAGEGDIDEGAADTEVVFAAEPWKHVHPAFGDWIDGVASAAVFARLVAAEGLAALCEPVTERPYRKESLPCPDDAKEAVMQTLEGTLPEAFPAAAVDTTYGIRLSLPEDGWVLVRPSGTEPYVRLYAESETVEDLVAEVRDLVTQATP
jgi:phosphomannomutase